MPSGVYIRTVKTRENISKGQKGIKPTKETRKKMSEAQIKNPTRYWEGKHRSEETKQKISKANKGCIGSRKGKKQTEETKKRIGESSKRVWANEEYKQKMREVHLGHKAWNEGLTKDTDERVAKGGKNGGKSSYNINHLAKYTAPQVGERNQAASAVGASAMTLATDFVDQLNGCECALHSVHLVAVGCT